MGVYQKLGVRNLAITVIDFITWVRQYGFSPGFSINRSLAKSKNGFFIIRAKNFKNPIYLRDNYSDKAIFYQVFYQQQYHLQQLDTFNAQFIIDAGANIGLASVYFSNLYPSARIIALEPEKGNFELLQKNTTAYANVTSLNKALWHKNEKINIQNPESLAASYRVEASADATIDATTVNDLLTQYQWDHIDIMKIDIEGAEKEIFAADTSWLRKVKVLIIELHDNYKTDCTKTFFKALEDYNYEALFHHENIFIFFK